MRSQKDLKFSELSDRVKVGRLLEEDIEFLKSRVMPCPSENSNENFKEGKVCIIVTTNSKKDFVNEQKLAELLPDKKEYICNSIDRVVNLPSKNALPQKLKDNAEKQEIFKVS